MNEVVERVKASGNPPTRQDIHDVLADVAPPGEKRDEKVAAVFQLFKATGHRSTNSQGYDVTFDLESYGAY
jgi:hypothetical protein